jgi:hypothetical protein
MPHGTHAPAPEAHAPGADYARDGAMPGLTAPDAPAGDDTRFIVYSGSISVEVGDLERALAEAEQLIVGLGGRVSATQRFTEQPPIEPYYELQRMPADVAPSIYPLPGARPSAIVTYRLPASHFASAVAALQRLGTVLSLNTGSHEVTEQVRDIEARLRNARATEAALLELMTKAVDVEDILAVQERLGAVRGEIEQLVAEERYLRGQADEATLSVTFSLPYQAAVEQQRGWSIDAELDRALAVVGGIFVGLPALVIRRRRKRISVSARC